MTKVFEERYIKFISHSFSYRELIKNGFTPESTGNWEVRGETENCDFSGSYPTPLLGFFEGTLKEAIEWAVQQPNWMTWGSGGSIQPARAVRAADLTDDTLAAISASTMDSRHDHLNAEMASVPNIVQVVVGWADQIQNDRTLRTIHDSIQEETHELNEEVTLIEQGQPEGVDGAFGEAVDILASTLDMLRQLRPNATVEDLTMEIAEYLNKKCHKWATKYGDYKDPYVPLKQQ